MRSTGLKKEKTRNSYATLEISEVEGPTEKLPCSPYMIYLSRSGLVCLLVVVGLSLSLEERERKPRKEKMENGFCLY